MDDKLYLTEKEVAKERERCVESPHNKSCDTCKDSAFPCLVNNLVSISWRRG